MCPANIWNMKQMYNGNLDNWQQILKMMWLFLYENFSFVHFLKLIIWKWNIQTDHRRGGRESVWGLFHLLVSSPRWSQWSEVAQVKLRSQEFHLDLPGVWGQNTTWTRQFDCSVLPSWLQILRIELQIFKSFPLKEKQGMAGKRFSAAFPKRSTLLEK